MANVIDPIANFALTTASAGIVAGATSITLIAGDGLKLPNPAVVGAFNAVLWNWTDYPDPSEDSLKEIVRVTAITGDVLTITRAQEGTTDVNHNIGGKTYKLMDSFTKKMLDDIRDNFMKTVGGIIFAGANQYPAVDTSNLMWDNTNKQLLVANGAAGNPPLSFLSDQTLGLYRPSANNVGIAIAGVGRYLLGASSFILGSTSGVSANTVDVAFNGSTPRLRMGITWYIQVNVTPPLQGVEMVTDLYPLVDLSSVAELGDLTRRYKNVWAAQINSGVLGNTEYNFIPIYNEREMINPPVPPYEEHYSKRTITINAPATLVTIAGRSGWYREIINNVGGVGSRLINNYPEFRQVLTQVITTGGVIDDTHHMWESFERAVVEWDIWVGGAHRNRYNWTSVIVFSVPGTPDNIPVVFPYALPDTNYTLEGTGFWIEVLEIEEPFRALFRIHCDISIDYTTKTINGATMYPKYTAFTAATNMWFAESDNFTALVMALGVPIAIAELTADVALRRFPA